MKRACPNNRHYIPETAAEGERNSRDEAVEKDGKIVHGASDCPVWKRRAARLFRMGKLYRIPNPGSRVDFYTKELMLRGRFVIKNLPPCGREPEAGKTGRKILLSLTAPNTHIFS